MKRGDEIKEGIIHYMDIIAIPFFLVSTIYWIMKPNKTNFEYVMLFWSLGGLVTDLLFTVFFFMEEIKKKNRGEISEEKLN
jgi:hypothetical protein